MALAIAGVIVLAQPIMLIIGGLVFAVILDGGTRLLGRVLPISRGWRLALVTLAGFAFIGWVLWFAGSTFVAQFEALRIVVSAQFDRLMVWADEMGFIREGSAASVGEQVLALGAASYLEKGAQPATIVATIEEALRRNGASPVAGAASSRGAEIRTRDL